GIELAADSLHVLEQQAAGTQAALISHMLRERLPGAHAQRLPVEEFFGNVPRFHRLGKFFADFAFREQRLKFHRIYSVLGKALFSSPRGVESGCEVLRDEKQHTAKARVHYNENPIRRGIATMRKRMLRKRMMRKRFAIFVLAAAALH